MPDGAEGRPLWGEQARDCRRSQPGRLIHCRDQRRPHETDRLTTPLQKTRRSRSPRRSAEQKSGRWTGGGQPACRVPADPLRSALVNSLNSWLLLVIFLACAAAIWLAGIKLSNTTDVLSERLHLGAALGGVILLAIATNLPEIAITASAALAHQLDVAVGNILGGIALQTVVLVVLDAAGVRPRRPLTYLAASLTLVLEGALVVALLLVVVMSTQLPASLIAVRITPGALLIAVIWAVGLLLVR